MTDFSDSIHSHQLVSADADAIDALIDAGFDLSRVPEALRVRAGHAASVMGLMDGTAPQTSQTLIDVTMARLARIANPIADFDAVLSGEDAEALDAYVAADYRLAKVPSSLRARAEQIDRMGQLLTAGHESTNALLVERTLRAVTTTRRHQEPLPTRSTGFRFADLISVAAVLLMGVAVAWPVMSTAKSYANKADCATNLAGIASAMGRYTTDFRDQLPMAAASFGGSWLNVGTTPDRSNSANLYTLARTGYTGLDTLACRGNPMAAHGECEPGSTDWKSLPKVSYSYYIMFGDERPTPVSNPQTVILTDRSPLPMRLVNGEQVSFPGENSPNHGGQGQFGLRADGSAVWMTTPQMGEDNLWLNGQQERYWNDFQARLPEYRRLAPKGADGLIIRIPMHGDELPESADNTFVGP